MIRHELYPDYHECYEYHGNTAVEITRKQAMAIALRKTETATLR
jgi:hypothetical protein